MMKIYIAFELSVSASGGGNQFLKALKNEFLQKGIYSDDIETADIILFNSYQYIDDLLKIKEKHPDKIYVHRVDGPICLYNKPEDKRDLITNRVNDEIADATIFQSRWSKEKCLENGLTPPKFSIVIMNAPDSNIFFGKSKIIKDDALKIKLISTSWSENINKGFETYKWLDQNLDFEKFDYVFVGNSPVEFENIIIKSPMCSQNLSEELRSSDIFITASKKDPCSNSLIEAIHCGLYPVALNDGGHTEIVKGNGVTFSSEKELLSVLTSQLDVNSYKNIVHNLKKMNDISSEYAGFFVDLLKSKDNGELKIKKLKMFGKLKIRYSMLRNKFHLRFGL